MRRVKIHRPRSVLLSLCLFLVATLTLSGSLAYYVSTTTTHHLVSTSGVKIELSELSDPTGETVPFTDLSNITPGVFYSKIPYVENTDTEPVWVRVKLTLAYRDSDTDTYLPIPNSSALITLGDLSNHWLQAEDGFYYYSTPLTLGSSSDPIFRTISFSEELAQLYPHTTYIFTIDAYATQSKHNGASPTSAIWTEEGV